jgi:hypothetical protein
MSEHAMFIARVICATCSFFGEVIWDGSGEIPCETCGQAMGWMILRSATVGEVRELAERGASDE